MGICTEYQELQEMAQEMSRDRWLAAEGASEIAEGIALADIHVERLEPLLEMIRAELQDRDLRQQDSAQLNLIEPF